MNQYDFLIVGGGVAAVSASKAVREKDANSSIAILSEEASLPVDRPPLSKQFLADDSWSADDVQCVDGPYFQSHTVSLHTSMRATHLDTVNQTVSTFDGKIFQYGKLLLATGSRAKTINAPGSRLGGIYTLRTVADADVLRHALLSTKEIVIVGGGFLAIEVAMAALKRGLKPTLIVRSDRLLPGIGSNRFASVIGKHLASQGAQFHYEDEAIFFAGSKALKSIHTKKGLEISSGLALIAIGSAPNTEWLSSSDLRLAPDGGVLVDHQLRTAVPTVWAAGDIASIKGIRIEHHLNAKWQGLHAGAAMAGAISSYDKVPYIYSDIGDLHINIRGHVGSETPALSLTGKTDGLQIEIYTDEIGEITGVLAWSTSDPLLDKVTEASELLIRRNMPVDGLCSEDFTDY